MSEGVACIGEGLGTALVPSGSMSVPGGGPGGEKSPEAPGNWEWMDFERYLLGA